MAYIQKEFRCAIRSIRLAHSIENIPLSLPALREIQRVNSLAAAARPGHDNRGHMGTDLSAGFI
jgi:hypothetical protein